LRHTGHAVQQSRAYRIDRTQSVWVLELVTQRTIEELTLARQARNVQLAENIYRGPMGRK